jgi:hypothetical protein
MWHIGRQTVGIVTETATVTSEFMEPTEPTESVAWVHNCLFEVQESARAKTAEDQRGGTVITNTTAWVFMPVAAEGVIPALDDDGNLITVDPATIVSSKSLRYGGNDYEMRGQAVLEIDINGKPDHVFCLCEEQRG